MLSFALWSTASILTPINSVSSAPIAAARVAVGVSQGLLIPSIHTVLAQASRGCIHYVMWYSRIRLQSCAWLATMPFSIAWVLRCADPAAGAARHGCVADDLRHVHGLRRRHTVPAGAGPALRCRLPDALQRRPRLRLAAAVAVCQQPTSRQASYDVHSSDLFEHTCKSRQLSPNGGAEHASPSKQRQS